MKRTILALLAAGLLGGAVFGLSGCYGTHAAVGVGVETAPPEPVSVYYDSRPGYTWIEGRWVWGTYGWNWYPGYWVAARPGYMYISGYWDYWGGRYIYRPGSWARYRNGHVWVGGRWHQHRHGHYYDHRRASWVPRSGGRAGHWSSGRSGYRSRSGYGRPSGSGHYRSAPQRSAPPRDRSGGGGFRRRDR
jgi:hypothetical protein